MLNPLDGTGFPDSLVHERDSERFCVPADVKSQAEVQLAGGVRFVSDADLKSALDRAGVPPEAANAIVKENATARVDGLRCSLSILAVIALIAVLFSLRIPSRPPGEDGGTWVTRGSAAARTIGTGWRGTPKQPAGEHLRCAGFSLSSIRVMQPGLFG